MQENTPEEAVVMCRKPFLYYIFSERRTIGYPFTRDRRAMRDYLNEAAPDYIVLEHFSEGTSHTDVYVVPVLQDMLGSVTTVVRTREPVNAVVRFEPDRRRPESAE
jgi:hypothetical protein